MIIIAIKLQIVNVLREICNLFLGKRVEGKIALKKILQEKGVKKPAAYPSLGLPWPSERSGRRPFSNFLLIDPGPQGKF